MPNIHPSAPPNHLAPDELRVRPGPDGVSLAIDPARAGWRYLAFRTFRVSEGTRCDLGGSGYESVIVVLAGSGLSLSWGEASLELAGRASVFDGKPWAAYLPAEKAGASSACIGATATAGATGCGRSATASWSWSPTAITPSPRPTATTPTT
jgi:5-deoxy-glucuronate isomerase